MTEGGKRRRRFANMIVGVNGGTTEESPDEDENYSAYSSGEERDQGTDRDHSQGLRQQENEEEDDDGGIDPSEMSAIDSFAQTQYSKYSKYYSKLGHSRFGGQADASRRLTHGGI